MKPIHISPLFRVFDHLMSPLMRLISLAPFESPQESHAWHAQKLDDANIRSLDEQKCVKVRGDDPSIIKTGEGALFHIPLIGGWKNYIVLQTESGGSAWHVGWIVRDSETHEVIRAELHKLPLCNPRVRMLIGPPERTTTFFAVNEDGAQLRTEEVGRGKMGDGSVYKHIRLF